MIETGISKELFKDLSKQLATEIAKEESVFEQKPAKPEEFISSPEYLNAKEWIFPEVKKTFIEIAEGNFLEAVCIWGIGGGKSTLASLCSVYTLHKLLCLRNPQRFFNLAPKSLIALINMAVNANVARDTVFRNIKNFISMSKWFEKIEKETLTKSIRFPTKDIVLIAGNSRETFPLGYNIIHSVLDEASFFYDAEGKSIAEEIYDGMKRRIKSRFNKWGQIILITSPNYVEDFGMRKYEKSKNNPKIYTSFKKTFEVNPNISKEDLTDEYDSNPEKALRDYEAVPSLVVEPFFRDPERIQDFFNFRKKSPFNENNQLKRDFKGIEKVKYNIHIDLGLKKDAAGFAMAHLKNENEIEVDLVYDFRPKQGNIEIDFSDIRNFIEVLRKNRKFDIGLVTLDGWQSVDFRQILEKKGIKSRIFSVDKSSDAYENLKTLIYTNRISCYYYEKLEKELKTLILLKGKKVDHSRHSSKDISDAVAGVSFSLLNFSSDRYTVVHI